MLYKIATIGISCLLGMTSAHEDGGDVITDKTFMDISIDGTPAGRIIFGLYGNTKPVTTKNFMLLSEGVHEV